MGLRSVRLGAYCQLVFEVSDLDEVADGVVGQVPEGSAGRGSAKSVLGGWLGQ